MTTIDPFFRVKQVARLIRQMSVEEQAALSQLVPELRSAPSLPPAQIELLAHFQPRLKALAETRPLLDTDPFIAGLSIDKFFALPETEQNRLWTQAHTEAEASSPERAVQPHALPAR